MNSAIFDMEMERLDSEIEKTRRQFYSAVLGKKRRVKRSWLEINTLTNAHLLQTLPYRAMLGHVAKVAEERDKMIGEILASKEAESSQHNDEEDADENTLSTSTISDCDDNYNYASSASELDLTSASFTSPETKETQFENEEESGDGKRKQL
ncbi:unnamed protein product [Orchesella dallaii]|uniref:Uncharacterized protein n=1 Tax=Orchesella dallaii TaxID=48710 RepID=A0ABP1QI26_9HEXA